MARLTKEYARYGVSKSNGDRCDECRWFKTGGCEIVEGRIAANGWCRFWHGVEKGLKLARKQDDDRDYVRKMRAG